MAQQQPADNPGYHDRFAKNVVLKIRHYINVRLAICIIPATVITSSIVTSMNAEGVLLMYCWLSTVNPVIGICVDLVSLYCCTNRLCYFLWDLILTLLSTSLMIYGSILFVNL